MKIVEVGSPYSMIRQGVYHPKVVHDLVGPPT